MPFIVCPRGIHSKGVFNRRGYFSGKMPFIGFPWDIRPMMGILIVCLGEGYRGLFMEESLLLLRLSKWYLSIYLELFVQGDIFKG